MAHEVQRSIGGVCRHAGHRAAANASSASIDSHRADDEGDDGGDDVKRSTSDETTADKKQGSCSHTGLESEAVAGEHTLTSNSRHAALPLSYGAFVTEAHDMASLSPTFHLREYLTSLEQGDPHLPASFLISCFQAVGLC